MSKLNDKDELLFIATINGNLEHVKELIQKGANPKVKDDDDYTALDYSASSGHLKVFKYINENHSGNSEYEKSRNAFKAMDRAIQRGNKEIFDYVLNAYPNAETWLKNDALWEASKSNQIEMVKELIARGAEIADQDNAPLRIASNSGHTEIVKVLLENGADVQASQNESLIYASRNGHTNTVKVLLEHGAYVQASQNESLINASRKGHADTVKVLLEHGADPHANDGEAILRAARNGHSKVIDVFLDKGIDIFKQDDCPIADAIYNKQLQVAENIILTHKIPLSEKSTNQLVELKSHPRADKTIPNLVDDTLRMNDKLLFNQKLESKLNTEPSFSLSSKPRQGLAKKMKSQGMKL